MKVRNSVPWPKMVEKILPHSDNVEECKMDNTKVNALKVRIITVW